MSYQSNLNQLMQMAAIEQLNNMVQQLNKTTHINTNTEVLSLPIVQKVIIAYEDELKQKEQLNVCNCKDYTSIIDNILTKLDEQSVKYNSIVCKLDELTKVVFSLENERQNEREIEKEICLHYSSKSIQSKLTSFPGFLKKQQVFDLTNDDDLPLKNEITVQDIPIIEEENITLKIEETFQNKSEYNNNLNELNLSDDYEQEEYVISVEEEEVVVEEEDVSEEQEVVVEEEEVIVEEEDVSEEQEVVVEEEDVSEEQEVVVEEDVSEEQEVVIVEEEDVSEEEVGTEDDDQIIEEEEQEDVVLEEASEEEDLKEEDEDEEGEEVFEIEIDDITYFATDEENGILYEVDKDGEVGKKVGIIKDGEPIFS